MITVPDVRGAQNYVGHYHHTTSRDRPICMVPVGYYYPIQMLAGTLVYQPGSNGISRRMGPGLVDPRDLGVADG